MKQELSCSNIKTLLIDYIGNELSESLKTTIERHLEYCPECQQEKETLEKMQKQTGELPAVTPSRKTYYALRSVVASQKLSVYERMKKSFEEVLSVPFSIRNATSFALIIAAFFLLSLRTGVLNPSATVSSGILAADTIAIDMLQYTQDSSNTRLDNIHNTPETMIKGSQEQNIDQVSPFLIQVSTTSEFGTYLQERFFNRYIKKKTGIFLSPTSYIPVSTGRIYFYYRNKSGYSQLVT